jgi:hypothetical protein
VVLEFQHRGSRDSQSLQATIQMRAERT